MNKIYSNRLQEIYYDAEKSLMKNIWLTEEIEFEEVKKEFNNWMEKFDETKPKYLLSDNTVGQIVTPDIQDWIIDFMYPAIIDKGAFKYAILISDELISMVTMEQMEETVEDDIEIHGAGFQQFFFQKDEEEKALNWLFS